jgi:hypothetical protein
VRRVLFAVIVAASLSGHAFAQTSKGDCPGYVVGRAPYQLRAVLEAFCIPVSTATFDVNVPVQYGAFNSSNEFLIAFNRVKDSEALEQPLRILHYDKQTARWTQTEFLDLQTEILPGLKGPCFGSVGGVQKTGTFFYDSVELSPSAGCSVVLSDDLKLKAVVSGGVEATFSSGAVVLAGSNVHFAPTHPLRLYLFDPRNGTSALLYPFSSDAFRAAYSERLRTTISEADRCRGENCERDPAQFDNDLYSLCQRPSQCGGPIAVNEATRSLAFVVQFSPIGFIPIGRVKNAAEWDEKIVYVYRLFPEPIAYRQFHISDMSGVFGATSLEQLLTPEALARIFMQ